MEKELTDILNRLHELTAKVEALLAAVKEPVSAPQEAPAPVAEEKPDIILEEPVVTDEPIEEEVTQEAAYTCSPIRFSINDRFRFQRTIFSNSPERMANAMAAISAMTTPDEVYTYLTNVLERDVNDPDVEDFFREVTLRFADHKPLII